MVNLEKCTVILLQTKKEFINEDGLFVKSELSSGYEQTGWFKRFEVALGDEQMGDFGYYVNQSVELYIVSNEEIPYDPKGTTGLFLCLDELDHPESVIVNNVGNCKNCRRIIATSDLSLDLPRLSENFISLYRTRYNNEKKLTEILVKYNWFYTNANGDQSLIDESPSYKKEFSDKMLEFYGDRLTTELEIKNGCVVTKEVKTSWNRDELIDLIIDAVGESHDWSKDNDEIHSIDIIRKRFLDKWIDKNVK